LKKMQVILLERIEKLGQMGQTVTVKPGYARNYLLPKKKAIRATKDNLAYFDSKRAQLEAENLKRKEEASYVAKKMEGCSVTLIRQASEVGQLYGSVRSRDIAEALVAGGYTVGRSQVQLGAPIKTLGIHVASLMLHPEVFVDVSVNIAQSEDEAAVQAEKAKKETL
jgi:large subunit ribosomal protein L9